MNGETKKGSKKMKIKIGNKEFEFDSESEAKAEADKNRVKRSGRIHGSSLAVFSMNN